MPQIQQEDVAQNLARIDGVLRNDGSLDLWEITHTGSGAEDQGFACRLSEQGWGMVAMLYAVQHPEAFRAIPTMLAIMDAHVSPALQQEVTA